MEVSIYIEIYRNIQKYTGIYRNILIYMKIYKNIWTPACTTGIIILKPFDQDISYVQRPFHKKHPQN